MTETMPFAGRVLCENQHLLGEGPTYDAVTDTAWWFSILEQDLHELHLESGMKRVHRLPMMASALARIDDRRQLLATENGLLLRDAGSGALTLHVPIEADRPGNRSNDGRVHPSGALWIGTMGKKAEDGAGAIYHVAGSTVTRLYDGISIPNGICFSPDGGTGYFVDTKVNRYMTVPLDAATGLPTGPARPFIDGSGEDGGMDGSVCDADGHIWNARWGLGRVDRFDPSGRLVSRHALPARQTSCPAFIGKNLDRMLVTTAYEGMSEDRAEEEGRIYELGVAVRGVAAPDFRL